MRDSGGNLYGTTYEGGSANAGLVFRVGKSGYEALYSFRGGTDGANPYAGVAIDAAGNLYGTTYYGGAANAGVVYRVDPAGNETVLYSFTGGADGANPYAGVTLDSAGNLYGTTVKGGPASAGVVFKVTPSGQETVLLGFNGKEKGANPYGAVVFDSTGNLYGTTYHGGGGGFGEIYKLSPSGEMSVFYSFRQTQGGESQSGVITDAAGNLYGTLRFEVYKVDPAGNYTMLHRFDGEGPQDPAAGLAMDAGGNLYGTAGDGGGAANAGLVYKIDTAGNFKELYGFPGGPTHQAPTPGVVLDAAGTIYGSSPNAGMAGMIYKLEPSGRRRHCTVFPPRLEARARLGA